jgi:6,7-dimethyl-8-ribityllumazine synthase
VAVSRFNAFATERLLQGAREALARCGVADGDVTVVRVPGAFELPLAAARLADTGKYDAIVCLGAVIKGETAHFEYISSVASAGIEAVAREKGVPVGFGVLTCYTPQQAMDRAGGAAGNRGYDVTVAALEMADLLRRVQDYA